MASFDVIHAPWLPVRERNGTLREVGVREALVRAHELVAVSDPMPTVEFGLYRLLVAFLLDIHRPEALADIGSLLEHGRLEASTVDRYLEGSDCRRRFDLFDPDHPFLQTGGMGDEAAKPLAGLLPAVPSGTNALHFHHGRETDFKVGPAVAARLLSAVAPFMTAGGAGLSPSINGAPAWYVLVKGTNLLETLLLNSCSRPLPLSEGLGAPSWRSVGHLTAERQTKASLLQSLTWQPRRIQLVPGAAGVCSVSGREAAVTVASMKFAAGWSVDFAWTDPNIAYRISDKGPSPVRPTEGKEVWRDTGPLALLGQSDYAGGQSGPQYRRPTILDQLQELIRTGYLPGRTHLDLGVYGMRTDLKMKVFEWQSTSLSLPAAMAWRSQYRLDAQRAIELAGDVEYALRRAVRKAYPRDGGGNADGFRARKTAACGLYWAALRPRYDELLATLAECPPGGEVAIQREWRMALRQQAVRALDAAIGDLDANADALFAQTAARRQLWTVLNKRVPIEAELTHESTTDKNGGHQ